MQLGWKSVDSEHLTSAHSLAAELDRLQSIESVA
jgi:hypothetical protein